MTHFWVVVAGFIFANFFFFYILWNNFANLNKSPKYLNSSYDNNLKNEVKSVLLNSIGDSITKYFVNKKPMANVIAENKGKIYSNILQKIISRRNLSEKSKMLFLNLVLRIKNLENFNKSVIEILKKQEEERNRIRITENTKISMFLDKEKKSVYILKVSNDGEVLNKYSYDGNNKDKSTGTGELSLYSVPLKNFLNKKDSGFKKKFMFRNIKEKFRFFLKYFLEKRNLNNDYKVFGNGVAKISNCFTTKFLGRIIGVVSSNDKNSVAIAYEMRAKSKISYRIRYFHNIQALCNTNKVKKQNYLKFENKIIDNFFEFQAKLESKNTNKNNKDNYNFNKIYYEIVEKASQNNDIDYNNDTKAEYLVMNNFLSNDYFDDFSLGINSPVKAIAIKKDILAFALDSQNFQFTILKRNRGSLVTKPNWFVFSQGPVIDRNIEKFFHTNSLKFLNQETFDSSSEAFNMIQITTTVKITTNNGKENKFPDVKTTGIIRKIKQINFMKFFENENKEINYLHEELRRKINKRNSIKFHEVDLVKVVTEMNKRLKPQEKVNLINCEYNKESIFDVKNCLKNFRSYLRPTLFSNNNILNKNLDSFIMEFNKGNLFLLEGSINKGNMRLMDLIPGVENKVEKFYSDSENKNILIKYENEENFTYVIREEVKTRVKGQVDNQYIELKKEISMKDINLPKLYKDKKPLAFLFEKIDNKNIAIFIDEKGIIHSLDFTDFRSNLINRTKPFNLFQLETYSNLNWDYLKYIIIISIAYCVFFSNSILNNEESNSDSNQNLDIMGESNNEINSNSQNNQVIQAFIQEEKLKKEVSQAGKKFLEQIKVLISKNNLEENENMKFKIIEMIETAEKPLTNSLFIPSGLLEELESIKSKLLFEEIKEENYNKLWQNLKKDFDEVSKISNTNSNISESTTYQSDSDEFFFSFEKKIGNFYFRNGMKIQKTLLSEYCLS